VSTGCKNSCSLTASSIEQPKHPKSQVSRSNLERRRPRTTSDAETNNSDPADNSGRPMGMRGKILVQYSTKRAMPCLGTRLPLPPPLFKLLDPRYFQDIFNSKNDSATGCRTIYSGSIPPSDLANANDCLLGHAHCLSLGTCIKRRRAILGESTKIGPNNMGQSSVSSTVSTLSSSLAPTKRRMSCETNAAAFTALGLGSSWVGRMLARALGHFSCRTATSGASTSVSKLPT
jgi:hypothetical protein